MNSAYIQAASAYGRAQFTRSELSVVVELYDRSVINLQKAKEARLERRFDQEFELVETVIKVFSAMSSRLNHKQGGSIAKTLENYYERLIGQLRLRHRAEDRTALYDSLAKQISVMRDAWSQVNAGTQAPAN